MDLEGRTERIRRGSSDLIARCTRMIEAAVPRLSLVAYAPHEERRACSSAWHRSWTFPRPRRACARSGASATSFAKSLALRRGGPRFVFYEGPPTANGLPHNGHVLTRVMKDVFPRYKTMRGFHVPRKARLGHARPAGRGRGREGAPHLGQGRDRGVRRRAVRAPLHRVRLPLHRGVGELHRALGFWLDMGDAYVTYHQSYVESVWWALSQLFERGLLYQGHKVVWWWAQGGTALSAAEVGEGYSTVDDPSIFVRFPLADEPGTSLLVWTTTPWTLPSNSFAAVNPDVEYVVVRDGEQRLIVAAALREALAEKVGPRAAGRALAARRASWSAGGTCRRSTGSARATRARDLWRVVAADFVALDAGTGIVHIAPAFGEDDFELRAASSSAIRRCRCSARCGPTARSIPRSPSPPTPAAG